MHLDISPRLLSVTIAIFQIWNGRLYYDTCFNSVNKSAVLNQKITDQTNNALEKHARNTQQPIILQAYHFMRRLYFCLSLFQLQRQINFNFKKKKVVHVHTYLKVIEKKRNKRSNEKRKEIKHQNCIKVETIIFHIIQLCLHKRMP